MSDENEELGAQFWLQPDTALREQFQDIYDHFLAALREEVRARGSNVLEFALIERVAYMYSYLRQRESDTDFTDRTRREMNKDFLEVSLTLRKLWGNEDLKNSEEMTLRKVNKAFSSVLADMPKPQAQELQQQLLQGLAAVGL